MKKITLIFFSLFVFLSVNAQVGIVEGLNAGTLPSGWTTVGFGSTTTTPCEGSQAWRRNFYAFATTGSLTSPNYAAASNGTDVTVTFQWKSSEWNAGSGIGVTMNAQYSTDNGGTWLSIGDPIVVTGVTACTTFSQVIPAASLPEGADFKFRVNGTWNTGDGYFWIDNISITQVTALPPNCDAALVSPADGATDVNLLGILSWSPATGLPSAYVLSVGTTPAGTDVVNAVNVGLATNYDIPGILSGDTTYYVTITPSNANGVATGCTGYSFTTAPTPVEGVLCENAIVIDALPYATTDNTTNYADVYYEGSPGASGCGTTSGYLNGNDVVYSYTSTFTGTAKILFTPQTGNIWGGLFIYGSCANIGVSCLGGVSGYDAVPRMIEEFEVVTGQTYYFVISTWATPQTIAYTLEITENTCTNGAATYTVASDCANGEQFMVNVNVTDLGSATSMTVSDDQGSAPQSVTATGIVTFGPYPNATPVIFTVNNDQDETCFLTSTALTQAVCPPSNDTCAGAIDLTNETSPLLSTTVGATNTNLTVCNNSNETVANVHSDVYYSILVPSGSMLTIGTTASSYDTANVVFYGDCENRTTIDCFDDPNNKQIVWQNTTGQDKTVYWVQDGWSGAGTFTLAWSVVACTPSQATYTVVSDCQNGEQFMVDVNVTNLGSATSVSISDDQGSEVQVLTATGIATFGPYPNATEVIFSVVNDQDDNCTLTSTELTQNVCPPNCEEAEVITACDEEYTAVFAGGAGAWNVGSCGWLTPGTEVLYSFTPQATGPYELEIVSAAGGYVDYFYKEASGSCDNTGWICIDDNNGAGIDPIGTLTAGVEYLFLLDSEGTDPRTHTFKIKCLPSCLNGTSTYTVVPDCENGEQFLVSVNVTSLGTATSVTVSDDQGSTPQSVTATGALTFGPYANNSPVIFTVANDQDETCVWTSAALNQVSCPEANDLCANAVALTVGAAFADYAVVGSNISATRNAADPLPTCDASGFANNGKDVWFSVAVPASGTLTLETKTNAGTTLTDTGLQVYSGTCGNIVSLGCNADDGDGNFSKLSLTALTPGEVLLARVWGYDGTSGTFMISAHDVSLSSSQFDKDGFRAYPNPVKDVLNLTYMQNISNVEVFNMLGQQVLVKAINATQGQLDMTNLSMGSYLVKITADNQVKTLKVIKQ